MLFTISEWKMAETIKMAGEQLFISWCELFTLMCLMVNDFFRVLNDYGCKYDCKSFCGCLYCSHLFMIFFIFTHCLSSICIISHHIGLQLQRLSLPHQWCYLLFQSKERLRQSKWLGRESLHMGGLLYWHYHFLSCSSQLKAFIDGALNCKN